MFSLSEIREGQQQQPTSAVNRSGFPDGSEYCPVKEMLLYQSKFNLHFIQSGDIFLSVDLAVIVSFSHLSCIQTVVC